MSSVQRDPDIFLPHALWKTNRLQPSPSVSFFLPRSMPLSFLHIFCSGFPLLSEINNNTAVTNPLFSTALVKSCSENSLSDHFEFDALTSKVISVSGNWLSLIRPNSFIISACKSNRGGELGDRLFLVSLFSYSFFFPSKREKIWNIE